MSQDIPNRIEIATKGVIDLSKLRLSACTSNGVQAEKALLSVPVKKPGKQIWFRVHPDPDYQILTRVLELKEELGESYLIDSPLWSDVAAELVAKRILTCVTTAGGVFLWPVRESEGDGRLDDWTASAHAAAEQAKSEWTRLVPNMVDGAYEVMRARGDLPEPKWPEESFQRLMDLAFKDRFIDTLDHPVLKKLRGA